MQREPIYEFVKGEGWVIRNNILTMACGTEVEWEVRLPKRDEAYMKVGNTYTLEQIPDYLKRQRFPTTRARQRAIHYENIARTWHIVVLHRVSDTPHVPDEDLVL